MVEYLYTVFIFLEWKGRKARQTPRIPFLCKIGSVQNMNTFSYLKEE